LSITNTNGYFLKSGDRSRHPGKNTLSMYGIVTPIISTFLSHNNTKDKVNFHNNITREEYYYGVYLRANPSNTVSEVPIPQACGSHVMKACLEDSSCNILGSVFTLRDSAMFFRISFQKAYKRTRCFNLSPNPYRVPRRIRITWLWFLLLVPLIYLKMCNFDLTYFDHIFVIKSKILFK